MSKSLIAFDTDRIKDYVFATDVLKEIRGASSILDTLNRIEMPKLIEEIGGRCCYAHGGSGLFIVPTTQAHTAIERVSQAYSEDTGGAATITGVALPLPSGFHEQEGDIQELWKCLGYKLAARKARNPEFYTSVSHPLLRFGHSDGTFYAAAYDEEGQPISRVSVLKRKRNGQIRDQAQQKGQSLPDDFDAIASVSRPKGYFALIYADGDALGRVLAQCPTLPNIQDVAKSVYAILDEARKKATKDIDSSHYDTLLQGGDDLVLAVPAHKALEVALTINEHFRHETKARLGKEYTLSTAIVWAHKNFPFGAWLDIAESVLKFAKDQGAKQETRGLINFLVISSANHLEFDQFYKQVLSSKAREQQILRTMRPYSTEDLRKLISYQQQLQRISRGPLEALRHAIFQPSWQQASLDALRVLLHWSDDTLRHRMHQMPLEMLSNTMPPKGSQVLYLLLFPFVKFENEAVDPDERIMTYATPIADLVELWDFIPGGADEERTN